jgi:hypothetical protein
MGTIQCGEYGPSDPRPATARVQAGKDGIGGLEGGRILLLPPLPDFRVSDTQEFCDA